MTQMTRLIPAPWLAPLAAAAALCFASLALAEDHAPSFPISVADAKAGAQERFKALDADSSGEISRSEFDQAAPMGTHRHRRPHAHHGWRGSDMKPGDWRAQRDEADAKLFTELDDDGDGQLSPLEFAGKARAEAQRKLMRERMFEHLDQDGNGSLNPAELPGMAGRLEAMDADGDGQVSREEAHAYRQAHSDRAR